MSLAGRLDITVEVGATFSKEITYKIDSTPADLSTVAEVRGQIRRSYNSESPAATFVLNVETPADDGKISWYLDAEDSSNLAAIDHVYDIEIEWQDGRVTRILEGKVSVKPNATR